MAFNSLLAFFLHSRTVKRVSLTSLKCLEYTMTKKKQKTHHAFMNHILSNALSSFEKITVFLLSGEMTFQLHVRQLQS